MAQFRVRVNVDQAGVRRMMMQPWMQREMDRRGQRVAAVARSIAPVRTGRYRASIRVRSGVRASGAYSEVVATAPYSYFLEVGTRHMAAQRILSRALHAAGG
ncbi:HK97 gp10 family phage protein [Polymorphospora lycopeni]|uniref:HK97 gp10 family phage protein n=1 Tax=Polymorphospora lycopeni TaxID=3140240 RepID=A0ABV5CKV0_9ACTN